MTFGPTLITVKNQLISADFNQPISDLAHNSTIFGQNHNVGHFSHSIFVTEPDSAVGIKKIPRILEFFGISGIFLWISQVWLFWSNGTLFPLNFRPWIRFWSQNWDIPKILEFWNFFGISGISLWISLILPFLAKNTMWGVFPTQFLSLNPILQSESKNSENSGISGISGISLWISQIWLFWATETLFSLNFTPWIRFWSQNWEIPKILDFFWNFWNFSIISSWLFWSSGTLFPLNFRPWIWF